MEWFFIICLVVCVVILFVKNQNLVSRINKLEAHDFFHINEIQRLRNMLGVDSSPVPQQEAAPQRTSQESAVSPQPQPNPTGAVPSMPHQMPQQPRAAASAPNFAAGVTSAEPSYQPNQPMRPHSAYRPNMPVNSSPQYQKHYQAANNSASSKLPSKTEALLGTHVFSVMASILIFIGIILLGTLAYQYLTDIAKIFAMYLISGGIIALGGVLSQKKKSGFTLSVLGCGFGSLYISILLTHIYFNAINDITAFALLLVWSCFTLGIAKKFDTIILSIIAHIGTAISICFAFLYGLTPERLPIIMIYQIAAIEILIAGNIFCCKKTYRFGLLTSLVIMCTTSTIMLAEMGDMITNSATPVIFIVQLLGASELSYLISVSATKYSANSGYTLSTNDNSLIIHLINKAAWCYAVFVNILCGMQEYLESNVSSDVFETPRMIEGRAITYAALIALAVIVVHMAITVVLGNKLNFNPTLETISITMLSVCMSIVIVIFDDARYIAADISTLFVVPLLLVGVYKLTRNKALIKVAAGLTIFSCTVSVFGTYFEIYDILKDLSQVEALLHFEQLLYMLVIAFGIALLIFIAVKDGFESKVVKVLKTLMYFWVNLSILDIFFICQENCFHFGLTLITLINFAATYYISTKKGRYYLDNIIRIASWINLYVNFIVICIMHNSIEYMLMNTVLTLATSALFAMNVWQTLKSDNTAYQVFAGFTFSCYTGTILFAYSDIGADSYATSFIFMITAAICIVFGFKTRKKAFRLYGLVEIMLCILKLVSIDNTASEPISRVIAFICGGIVCFAISAIYNYFEKIYVGSSQATMGNIPTENIPTTNYPVESMPTENIPTTNVQSPDSRTQTSEPETAKVSESVDNNANNS